MHDKVRIDDTRLFQLIGNDTTDEVGLGSSQSGHQVVQLFLVGRRHRREATTLLTTATFAATATTTAGITRLTGMIGEDLDQQFVTGFLELIDHSVVQRVLVLFQPARDVVWYLLSLTNGYCWDNYASVISLNSICSFCEIQCRRFNLPISF